MRVGPRVAVIEAKYGIPYNSGDAMNRLVAQLNAAVSSGTGGQVVLWTLKAPSPAQMSLLQKFAGGILSNVEVVSGVEPLYQWMAKYFGPF